MNSRPLLYLHSQKLSSSSQFHLQLLSSSLQLQSSTKNGSTSTLVTVPGEIANASGVITGRFCSNSHSDLPTK